ncbi:phage capsid protein [Sphingobium cupriresistens LL01]|uniref:Phage capsid protein n=1 Tax=Sphingobium cupriresistens LL01 TaxID=1420583 RepID=A0A0J7XIS8_9SPHN|nr:phage capsid protein [Sphingobium cupriresistens LL01]
MNILTTLSRYDPHVAGTPPLGLDVPTSDIDILCHALDLDRFTTHVWNAFNSSADFRIWQWSGGDKPVIAAFKAEGWQFEIFGQARPVEQQRGWRHFLVEQRLIRLGGKDFVEAVMAFRRSGMKTEPAFAAALDMEGDPYELLFDIASLDEDALVGFLHKAGYI